MLFEYDSEEIAYLRGLLREYLGADAGSEDDANLADKVHKYLTDNNALDCSEYDPL